MRINVKITSDFSKQPLIFKLIEKMIIDQRKIIIIYKPLQSEQTEKEMDPYNLIFKRYAWHLVSFCYLRKGVRIFRINAVKDITLLTKKFEKIPGFSIDGFFKESWETYQEETFGERLVQIYR